MPSMRSRRASRLVAATVMVFLAASGAGACLFPRTPAGVKECCRTRCDHTAARAVRTCCCKEPGSTPTAAPLPDARPPAMPLAVTATLPAVAVAPAPVALVTRGTAAPPGSTRLLPLLL